jgi:hypothetical protein
MISRVMSVRLKKRSYEGTGVSDFEGEGMSSCALQP